jgi:hypothetical protein
MKITNGLGGPLDFSACLAIVIRCAKDTKDDKEVSTVLNLVEMYLDTSLLLVYVVVLKLFQKHLGTSFLPSFLVFVFY